MSVDVDGIEHCTCLTPNGIEAPPALAERLATAGTLVCPTLGIAPGVEPGPQFKALLERTGLTVQHRLALFRTLYAAGVMLVSGSDAGIGPAKPHGVLPEAVIDLVADRAASGRSRRGPVDRRRRSPAGHHRAARRTYGVSRGREVDLVGD